MSPCECPGMTCVKGEYLLTCCSVKMGNEGGERAAHVLQDEIRRELQKLYPSTNTNNWNISVVVIAALDSLSYAYQNHLAYQEEHAGVYWNTALRQFAIGFNRGAHHTFNFIDIGGGKGLKELTDTKLRETFSLSMASPSSPLVLPTAINSLSPVFPHCKHVFFAGCHDSGYVSFLGPYKHDRNHADKVTLIETHNTNPHYYSLGFKMTSFPGLFRSEDFPTPASRVSMSTTGITPFPMPLNGRVTPPSAHPARTASITELPRLTSPFAAAPSSVASTRIMTPSTNRAATPSASSSQASSNWVTVSKSGVPTNGKTVIDIAPTKKKAKAFIALNREGERVDIQLPKTNKLAEQSFHKKVQDQGQNFCNTCNIYGPDTCDQTDQRFLHGRADLSTDEFNVLRMKVRGLPCAYGSGCPDSNCAAGHHCRNGRNCVMTTCRFADTHHMDIVSLRRLRTDSYGCPSPQLVTDHSTAPLQEDLRRWID